MRRGALIAPVCGIAAWLLAAAPAAWGSCAAPKASPAYRSRVAQALTAKTDIWGNALLNAPGGPTFAGANRHLAPLLYARTNKGRPLTASGVYYLPFSEPLGPSGAGAVALHVADGSEILSGSTSGPGLLVSVGGSRFGSCLARLAPARLSGGWLPILETRYAGYRQESFAAREGGSLVSFLHVSGPGRIELRPTVRGLRRRGNRLVRGGRTYLTFAGKAVWNGRTLSFRTGVVYATWLDPAAHTNPAIDPAAYATARSGVASFWRAQLAKGARLQVPEARVMNAERALLVQSLQLSWRYSIGNPYEEFSFPESLDGAQVMAELGFEPVSRSILRVSLTRKPRPYPAWTMGEKLLAAATYVRLSGDRAFLSSSTARLGGYVTSLERRQESSGLIAPEHFSSDIPDAVQGLHAQTVVWEGLRDMAAVWSANGHPRLAARARHLAGGLGTALHRAVARSETKLADGSLFLPMRLDDGEQPYGTVTESREGSYWNLVAPYALASGFFPAGSAQARGALDYLLQHGSRLLGLVRAGGYALYGPGANPGLSGTDEVYGLNIARFLAANDQADELVLSLYGQLAAAMTPNTFVAGEGASVAPLDGLRYRAMYLPPNSVANDSFLETLELMLVQASPDGLRLGYATPRAWLRGHRTISVADVPTGFGSLSFSLAATTHAVHVQVVLGPGKRLPHLLLRLRLPAGKHIRSTSLGIRFDRETGTLDLTGQRRSFDFVVQTT